jgi:hypothetical protein
VEKMEAKDIITTRIPKALHKERPVGGVLRAAPRRSVEESRIRSLQKVLRQIMQLAEKQNAGGVLDAAQLAKLERMDSVVFELNELLADEEDDDEVEEDETMEAAGEKSSDEEDAQVDETEENDEEEEKEKGKRTIQSKGNRKKKKSKTSE